MRKSALKGPPPVQRAPPFVLVAALTACNVAPVGGLVVQMDLDPALLQEHPTQLTIDVGSINGTTTYKKVSYPLDDASAPGLVHFPATFAIDSNGDPNAGVAIDLGVWSEAQRIDRETYEITNLPTTRVAELKVVLGLACAPVGPPGCSRASPVDPWACDGRLLPGLGADSGSQSQCTDAALAETAAGEPDTGDATTGDATTGDATLGDASEGGAGEPGDDAEAGSDAYPSIPCDAPCGAGQQCVAGTCESITPPSCLGGTAGAGPSCGGASGTDDCCASDGVPGGQYYRGYDGVTQLSKQFPATVSRYRLDRYEVTVGRFRAFVDAVTAGDAMAPWAPAKGSGKHTQINGGLGLSNGGSGDVAYETGWDDAWNVYLPQTRADWEASLTECSWTFGSPNTWTSMPGSNEKRPIDCVTWYEAYAFCIWDDAFLPSANEWEFAAAGGDKQFEFAWGFAQPGSNASYAVYDCFFPPRVTGNDCQGVANVAPVGSIATGVGLWGQMDLTGNVYEWTLDYEPSFIALPCVDCSITSGGAQRGIRGGAFDSDVDQLPVPYIIATNPDAANPGDLGVRCARPPLP
jgi:sulfatase modifying factor 1